MADAFGSTGLPSPSGSTYQQNFLDPKLVKNLATTLGGVQQGAASAYLPFLQNPTASPLFQGQLSGLLASLQPSEDLSRRNLSDQLRASGNSASSTGAGAIRMGESDILRNRQTMASQLLGQSFDQIVRALMAPQQQIPQLINSLKLAQSQGTGGAGSTSSQWGSIPASQGLQTQTGLGPLDSAIAPIGPGGATLGPNASPIDQLMAALGGGGSGQWGFGTNTSFDPTGAGYLNNQPVQGNQQLTQLAQQLGLMPDEYGFTQQDWANDPYYNNPGEAS